MTPFPLFHQIHDTTPTKPTHDSRQRGMLERAAMIPKVRRRIPKRNDTPFRFDTILPSQFFATLGTPGQSAMGERRLLVAVLEDAVRCLQKYAFTTDDQKRQLFEDAKKWFLGDVDEHHASRLSFKQVCEVLGLDPANVRGGLQRWYAAQLVLRRVELTRTNADLEPSLKIVTVRDQR